MTWLYFLAFGFVCFWLGVALGHQGALQRQAKDACPFKTDEGTEKMIEKIRQWQLNRMLH